MKYVRQFLLHGMIAHVNPQTLITDTNAFDPVNAGELCFSKGLHGFQVC